jgi:hypothetical protein
MRNWSLSCEMEGVTKAAIVAELREIAADVEAGRFTASTGGGTHIWSNWALEPIMPGSVAPE